jgi:hypothetical protein
MNVIPKRLALGLAMLAALVTSLLAIGGGGTALGGKSDKILKNAANGTLKPAKITSTKNGKTVTRALPFISDATVLSIQEALHIGAANDRNEGADVSPIISATDFSDLSGGKETLGCAKRDSKKNVRVNQDCSFRRQAEEEITYNPADPSNLIAGQNDSRVGYNQCGIDWSTDSGKHWGDMIPPFRQHENAPDFDGPSAVNPNNNTIQGDPGTYHTYDAGSDPAVAVDSQGRAYFSCVVFDVFTNANGLYVTQAPAGAEGAFYFNIPSSITGTPTKRFLVVEDNPNGPYAISDKNFIAADRLPRTAGHPTGDNVYVTWTEFLFDAGGNFLASPIFGSMSTDGGLTWSTPQEISGNAPGLCFFGNVFDTGRSASDCDFDQGSDPVVLPNGDVVIAFNNGNTPAGNPNGQQLALVCHPSGDSSAGTANLGCGTPTKIGDDILVGEPQCDFGRGPEECIPGPYIRTNDFPRILTENTRGPNLYVVWQDYRNGEYDIQMSRSTDGGSTWTEVGRVNPDTGLDHYMPAVDQSPSKNDRIGVSYYRSERVSGENDGTANCLYPTCVGDPFTPGLQPGVGEKLSDYVLAGGTGDATPYDFKVVSPVFPPPNGIQSGFNGDYSGLTIPKGEEAHPIWADTRNLNPFALNGVVNDEDVFTDQVPLPNGKGKAGAGKVGKTNK